MSFGFITSKSGTEHFAHCRSVRDAGPLSLRDGQKGAFLAAEGGRRSRAGRRTECRPARSPRSHMAFTVIVWLASGP